MRQDHSIATILSLAAIGFLVSGATPAAAGICPRATTAIQHFGVVDCAVRSAAIASQKKWGVPASVVIAQWAVESAWGASVPLDSNNPLGLFARPGEPSVDAPSNRFENGQFVIRQLPYRRFKNINEAFDEHGRLIATNPHYKAAMENRNNPAVFADQLTGTYSTDPSYGATLKYLIETYRLSSYDTGVTAGR